MPVKRVKVWKSIICHHPELVNIYECEIGEGTKIGAFVEIGKGVKIGRYCKIQTGAFIPEGVIIKDGVFIGPNVTFCNVKHPMTREKYINTFVMDNAVIGANATILPGVTIGIGAVVGAGAVVVGNVPSHYVIKGYRAR